MEKPKDNMNLPCQIVHQNGPGVPALAVYYRSNGQELVGNSLPVLVISKDYSFTDYWLEVEGQRVDEDIAWPECDDEMAYEMALKYSGLPSVKIIEELHFRSPGTRSDPLSHFEVFGP